ncbi:YitT family protein [Salinicoccus roseus]|uniref:YitT family protein n=2 Tax=Salinicoccus roseus TaxID=45670 RepID=A0ABT4YIX2_9STAP|nr:YitT family protein [Salinicoccus roseus]MDB0580495.1 YitT family protein [Salinicoccus roseus]
MIIKNRLERTNFEKVKAGLAPAFTLQTWMNILAVILGAFLFSIGVNLFMIPGNLGDGGVSGLAIIILYAFDISPAISTLVLNGLLLIVGFRFLSRRGMYYTIFAVIMMSVFLGITESWFVQTNEVMLNVIFGGLFLGLGNGLVIRIGATTAGSAILGRIAHKYLDVKIANAVLIFDLMVITLGLTVLTIEQVLLTVVAMYINVKVMDFMIEGMNPKKAITIISKNPEMLGKLINSEIGWGVTMMNGKGFYSREENDILYVVINKSKLTRLKRLIQKYDEEAFVVVNDVNSVLGSSFV